MADCHWERVVSYELGFLCVRAEFTICVDKPDVPESSPCKLPNPRALRLFELSEHCKHTVSRLIAYTCFVALNLNGAVKSAVG